MRFISSLILFCSLQVYQAAHSHPSPHHHEQPDARIIGGDESPSQTAPFMVAIKKWHPGQSQPRFCGGTILNDRFVLTAAHCMKGTINNELAFGVQRRDGSNGELQHLQRRFNGTYAVHESYDAGSKHNDVAIIKLSRPIVLSSLMHVRKTTLPSTQEAIDAHDDKTATAYGWGYTHDRPPAQYLENALRQVDVPVISNNDCKKSHGHVFDGNICTSNHGKKGTCNGDSGGPLMLNGVQIGITSYGDTLCELDVPSVYVRVDRYLDWIERKMREM